MLIKLNHITLLFILILSGWVNYASAQRAPSAGTQIQNKALFSFTDGSGNLLNGESNTVNAVVGIAESIDFFPNHFVTQKKDRYVYFDHTLVNTSNAQIPVTIQASNSFKSDFAFENVLIDVYDEQGNQINLKKYSPELYDVSKTVTIPAGSGFVVRVEAYIPTTVSVGQLGIISVQVKGGTRDRKSVV